MDDQRRASLTGAESVRWDLTPFYQGLDDPKIDADLTAVATRAKAFSATYKGRLDRQLGAAIAEYAEIGMLSMRVMDFLFLLGSTNLGDAAVNAKKADADQRLSQVSAEHLTFFALEIGKLDEAALLAQKERDAVVAKHWPFITQIRRFTPHFLSEEVESALTVRGMFGASAWGEFFDEVEDDVRFAFEGVLKTQKEILHLVNNDPSADRRAAALDALDKGLTGAFEKYSAQTLWMVSGEKRVEDRERKYPQPMSSRNLSNMISDEAVEALHAAVTKFAAPLAQRHYRLKAKLLGAPTLKWSDRNAPLPFEDAASFPYDEALRIVLDAYAAFSPTLAALVRRMIDERRIDAPAVPKKHSGAFNSSAVIPGGTTLSYVLLNYLGSTRDVMTIAHELGHAVHGLLAGEAQGSLMSHAPMAYAETASVFGEMTTFNDLRRRLEEKGDKKSLLALIHGKIDDILNTAVRQIGFSNFERKVHGAGKRLSADELSMIWMDTLRELYGKDGDVFTYENASRLWSYISHFHRPFYVYSYAVGELFTQSLYAARAKFGADFEPMYLELLRAGGTKDGAALLAPFGLDPANPKFWEDGIRVSLEKMVEEEERLAAEI